MKSLGQKIKDALARNLSGMKKDLAASKKLLADMKKALKKRVPHHG